MSNDLTGFLGSILMIVLFAGAASCSNANRADGQQQGQDVASLGQPCDASKYEGRCSGGVCVAGVCRVRCETDADCKGTICLKETSGVAGGCRLPSEQDCSTAKPCPAAPLECGLDATCRIPCTSERPCPRADLTCIEGACFGKLEDGASGWLCGGASPGDRSCEGQMVRVCDVGGLGWVHEQTCEDQACIQGACVGECVPGTAKCNGNALQKCDVEGQWGASEPCQHSACVSGGCVGICEPGATKCKGNTAKTCDAQGQWGGDVLCAGATPRCSAGACQACPGTAGPAMVVMTSSSLSYCIDSTEVTRDQYAAWLAGNPTTSGQDAWCAWNVDFTPSCEWPPGANGTHPVVCVDWCDAFAYCKAVGKRLCGEIGAGAAPIDEYADATTSQWFNACTSEGQNDYTFGDTYDGQSCNGKDKGIATTVAVGSLSTCQSSVSGYVGVYDLSGNVWEWEDSCSGGCRVRGGSFSYSTILGLRCDHSNVVDRSSRESDIGFRRCSDP
jgi:formylglycine-generating enzyme